MRRATTVIAFVVLLIVGSCVCGQEITLNERDREAIAAAEPTPTPGAQSTWVGEEVKRWFDLDTALLQTRYQNIRANASPAANVSTLQWQVYLKSHFQFD